MSRGAARDFDRASPPSPCQYRARCGFGVLHDTVAEGKAAVTALATMTVGVLSKTSDVELDLIRTYEAVRLLARPRKAAGFLLYRTEDIERLNFIRRAVRSSVPSRIRPDPPVGQVLFHADVCRGNFLSAGVVVPVTGAVTSPPKGEATLTDALAADLLAGKLHFNIHTAANKGGEIRGQVTKGK